MITISSDKLIRDIQREFNLVFPFLKIEFFRHDYYSRHKTGRAPSLPSQLKLGTAYTRNKEAVIDIQETSTMKDLERACIEQFGISLQVYRKSGSMWLETTMTDNWTMKQQNESGLELSMVLK